MTTIELEAPRMAPSSLVHLHDGLAGPPVTEPTKDDGRLRGPSTQLVRRGIGELRSYYGIRRNRLRLVATALTLLYVGGAAMFWLHAIHRGEAGPDIAHSWHWLLDSTLGLVGLGPVLVVLLPLAHRLSGRRDRVEPLIVGAIFAMVTTPGPVFHNIIAGKGTPLARLATDVVGRDPQVAASHTHVVEHSMVSEALLQLAVGLPVYVALASVVWWALRRRAGHPATRQVLVVPTTQATAA